MNYFIFFYMFIKSVKVIKNLMKEEFITIFNSFLLTKLNKNQIIEKKMNLLIKILKKNNFIKNKIFVIKVIFQINKSTL